MEICQVNELLAFVLPMQHVNHFLFIHHMTFSLTGSYQRTNVALNFRVMLFRLGSRSVCTQFVFLILRSK